MKKLSLGVKTAIAAVTSIASIGVVFGGLYGYSKIEKGLVNQNQITESNSFSQFEYTDSKKLKYVSNLEGRFFDGNNQAVAYVDIQKVDGKLIRNKVRFNNETKLYTEQEFFNEYLKRYNNQTPTLKVKMGPTEFVNDYLEAVGISDFMDYVDWFIQNVAWGPDVLTLDRFRITKGVNKKGSTITLGGHTTLSKETKEITFWPDSFFGSLPLFNEEAGAGNGSDRILSKINRKAINKQNVINLLKEFVPVNTIYNYPGELDKKPDYQNSKGQFKDIKLINLMTNPTLNYHFYEITVQKNTDPESKLIVNLEGNTQSEILASARKLFVNQNTYKLVDKPIKQVRVVRTNFIKNENLLISQQNIKENLNLSLGYIYSNATDADRVGSFSLFTEDSPQYKKLVDEWKQNEQNIKDNVELAAQNKPLKPVNKNLKKPAPALKRIVFDSQENNDFLTTVYQSINTYLFSKIQTFKDFVNFKIYLLDFNKYYKSLSQGTGVVTLYNIISYYNSDDVQASKKLARELYLYNNPAPNDVEPQKMLFKTAQDARRHFGSKFDSSRLVKHYLRDLKLENQKLNVVLEVFNKPDTFETIILDANDDSLLATSQLSNLKQAVGYKVAYSPSYLSVSHEYKAKDKETQYELDLYNEVFPDLINIIKNKYPYLLRKNNGAHVERVTNKNGGYEYKFKVGNYQDFTTKDRISFIMLLKAIDPNFKGVGINFLKYVGAHEYGHHSTLQNIQDISNKDYSVLIGGINTRTGPSDQSFFDKDIVREYLYARSSKLDILNKNLALDKKSPNAQGNYPVFASVIDKDGKIKIVPEKDNNIWGSTKKDGAKVYFEAFTNAKRRALQTVPGLQNAAQLLGLKIYDLFLLNSFDHDSGTLSPSITGDAQYFQQAEEIINGKKVTTYNYKFTKAGQSQLQSILKDGSGKPITFIKDATDANKFIAKVFEIEIVRDKQTNKEVPIVKKVLINDINNKPIYILGTTTINKQTIIGEVYNSVLRKVESNIRNTIAEMMDTKYYINGWQNADMRGGENRVVVPTFKLSTTMANADALHNIFDPRLFNLLKKYNYPVDRLKQEHPDFFGKPSFAQFVSDRDAKKPVYDATAVITNLSAVNLKYNQKLDAYKDLPVLDNMLLQFLRLAPTSKSKNYISTFDAQKDKFTTLRFIDSTNNIVSQYFGNSKKEYNYYQTLGQNKVIGDGGVLNIFAKLFISTKNNPSYFSFYKDDKEQENAGLIFSILNDEKSINSIAKQVGIPDTQTFENKRKILINAFMNFNNVRINQNSTLFREIAGLLPLIKKEFINSTTPQLQFNKLTDLVEFLSLDYSKYSLVKNDDRSTTRNWNLDYVATKFDTSKLLEYLNNTDKPLLARYEQMITKLTNPAQIQYIRSLITNLKADIALLAKTPTNQTAANIIMSRFENSGLYAFNTDHTLIDFSNQNNQKAQFIEKLRNLYAKNVNFDNFSSTNFVNPEDFATASVGSKIPISTEILFDKIWNQFVNYYDTKKTKYSDRGKIFLSDLNFFDGKYSRLNSEYFSYFGHRAYLVKDNKPNIVELATLDSSYWNTLASFTYSFKLENSIHSKVKTFFNSRINTDLGQVFTDYTYNLPEVLTRDYVQTTYIPETKDFRTLNSFFKGISEYSTGLEYFVNGQITQRFIENTPNPRIINTILGMLSNNINKTKIKKLTKDYLDNDDVVTRTRQQIKDMEVKIAKYEKDPKFANYFNNKKAYTTANKAIVKLLDNLSTAGKSFSITSRNMHWYNNFQASYLAGPAADILNDLFKKNFDGYIGPLHNIPYTFNEKNTGLQIKFLSVVQGSGDDDEGSMILKYLVYLPGVKASDINKNNSVEVLIKLYGFKNKDGKQSASPLASLSTEQLKETLGLFKENLTKTVASYTQLINAPFETVRKEEQYKDIELVNQKIIDLKKAIEDRTENKILNIKKENSFGLFGTTDFTIASTNPNYIGQVRKQNNGFFKDRWLRKELGWELYDKNGNSVVDENIRILDFEKKAVTDRARAFWIYLLKSKGVGDRNVTGIWRNKEKDAVALWGFERKEIIAKLAYLEFEDAITGKKSYIKVNTKNTNNLFYYKKQARRETKWTIEDEGYSSWVSEYAVMANYQNALLKPGNQYFVRMVDKDKKLLKNLTTGSKKTLAENGKTYDQAPITMKTVVRTSNDKKQREEIAIIDINNQFNGV